MTAWPRSIQRPAMYLLPSHTVRAGLPVTAPSSHVHAAVAVKSLPKLHAAVLEQDLAQIASLINKKKQDINSVDKQHRCGHVGEHVVDTHTAQYGTALCMREGLREDCANADRGWGGHAQRQRRPHTPHQGNCMHAYRPHHITNTV